MKKTMKFSPFAFWLILGISTFLLLQFFYEFHFYYMEQFQLFQYNKTYLCDLLFSFGGVSETIARWLLQFYMQPKLGALITTALLMCIALLMERIAKKINPNIPLILFPLAASFFTFLLHLNHNYYIGGTVAFILALLSLLVYLRFSNTLIKAIIASLLTAILFWWAGSVSILFVSCILLFELLTNRKKLYYCLIPVCIAFFLTIASVYLAWVGEFRFILLPDLYFHSALIPPSVIYFSWWILLLMILIACLSRGRNISTNKKSILFFAQVAITVAIIYWALPLYAQHSSLQYKKLDYYARIGEWDNIIEESKRPLNNLLYVYYLNLALTEKQELADRFLQFDQKGSKGLFPEWNRSLTNIILLNDIHFALGNTAGAQHMAFEGNVSISKSGSPRLYKRLVQTNLIFGTYSVAEKYIKLLEQTHYYKEWATLHRRFLYNDQAVEADPLLGKKRREIPNTNYLYMNAGIANELDILAKTSPSNIAAKESLGTLILLEKQVVVFMNFIDSYYSTEEEQAHMPYSFQEAIIIANEKNPEEWKKYKINPAIIARFEAYKQMFLKNKNDPNPAKRLNPNFGNTYWYYFMFK